LRIVLHTEVPEDDSLHRQWNELVLQVERPEVFFTCEWALAMQSAYRASFKPILFLGYDGENLVGVASFATDPSNRNVTFLAANTADYCEFLSHPSRRAEFVDGVFAEFGKMKMKTSTIVLANLPADSATPGALRDAAVKHKWHIYARPAYSCAQVLLGEVEERQKFKHTVARKKMLLRKLRGLEQAGSLEYAHLRSWASIEPVLQDFANTHAARFSATGRVSSLASSERRHFLEDLARRFSDSGVVTLSVLKVNGQPAAWNYGFQFQGSWFWYQPTFDSRWEAHSPGYCLLAKIVIDACDREDLDRVDLGLGDEGYKERFGNAMRQTLYVTVTRSMPRHLQEIARYRAASLLRRSPKVNSAVRDVFSKIGLLDRE
jgi:CelD/BcsL family acetyltransferase involved in cellulose biosynthesis